MNYMNELNEFSLFLLVQKLTTNNNPHNHRNMQYNIQSIKNHIKYYMQGHSRMLERNVFIILLPSNKIFFCTDNSFRQL